MHCATGRLSGLVPTLKTPMNVNRGGAFQDESFGHARAKAMMLFEEVFGPDSDEFLEFSDNLVRDFNLRSRPSDRELHSLFLDAAAQAIRPQDRAS